MSSFSQPTTFEWKNVVGCANEDIYVGMPVELVFERDADGVNLPRFRPRGGG